MAPTNLQHRRTHNLLLISKLLNQRDAASPFTLVFDSLEQSGKPVVAEYLRRAKAVGIKIVFVSFETLKPPRAGGDDVSFIPAWSMALQAWQKQVVDVLKANPTQRTLLIFDSLNPLSSSPATSASLPAFLSSFISPTTSLLAVYHDDSPTPSQASNVYNPSPSTLLRYLATTILTPRAFSHVLACKAARERSLVEPSFGLEEGAEGIVQGIGANSRDGVVIEMEHRRKSGRGVKESYFFPLTRPSATPVFGKSSREIVMLLEDHPLYRTSPEEPTGGSTGEETSTTFELGLTEKQRRDREGVVLPYYDAQKGGGEGGRILYDMGSEDDFDEDEDEI